MPASFYSRNLSIPIQTISSTDNNPNGSFNLEGARAVLSAALGYSSGLWNSKVSLFYLRPTLLLIAASRL
jgi:hypothetical protein